MMKYLLILVITIMCIESQAQTNNTIDTSDILIITVDSSFQSLTSMVNDSGYYKVINIDTLNDFYLISVTKNNESYTIYSEINLIMKGQKLVVDSTYFFELSCNNNILPHVTYYPGHTGMEIGKLCTAKHLVGLVIPSTSNACKTKKESK